MTDQHDPQDIAEQLDEDVTNADPGNPEQNGLLAFAPDDPVAVEEELVTEPIVDSVASRDERLQPETMPDIEGAPDDLTPDDLARDDLARDALASALDRELGDGGIGIDLGVDPLAADPDQLAPEEAALHLIDDSSLG